MRTCTTESQSAAARANGARSRGPVSPEGKERSATNATRHGLSSRRLLVDGESEDDLNALRVYWMRQLQPLSGAEREVAEEVVAAEWRLRRCQKAEAGLLSVEMKKLGVDPADPDAFAEAFKALADSSRALDLMLRYSNAARRDFDRALKRFDEVVARRRAELIENERVWRPIDFRNKWGLEQNHYLDSYFGKFTDLLPNEPEPAPLFHDPTEPEDPAAAA